MSWFLLAWAIYEGISFSLQVVFGVYGLTSGNLIKFSVPNIQIVWRALLAVSPFIVNHWPTANW